MSLRSIIKFHFLLALIALALFFLAACSATTLRCGTDGEASYVDLTNVPQDLSSAARYYTELCGFAYEAES